MALIMGSESDYLQQVNLKCWPSYNHCGIKDPLRVYVQYY
jgi:hypothetical protein